MITESADKRSVSTDALETLGMIHFREEKRDAIHLAVEPIEAAQQLYPGMHIKIENGKAVKAEIGKGLGIVDPFLFEPVYPGKKFWLVVYPRKISSLRHVWTHPDFSDDLSDKKEENNYLEKNASVSYLVGVAAEFDISYEELLRYAKNFVEHDEYACEGEKWDAQWLQDAENFWKHYDIVTGGKTPADKRHNFFSCSC